MNLVVRAEQQSLWLCFERLPPWPAELPVDITRAALEIMPPVRSEPDRLN